MKRCFILVILIFLAAAWWSFAADVWTMEDTMQTKWPLSIAISPDKKFVVYSVISNLMEEETSKTIIHIWITALEGSREPRSFPLTSGAESCTEPAWSPDSKWIAFLSSRLTGKSNIWLIRPDGGEAIRLTDVETSITHGSMKWSPDGKYIAFLMEDPESQEEKKAARTKNDPIIVDSNWKYNHIYKFKVEDGMVRPQKGVKITGGDFDVSSLDWSPEGKGFVFTHRPTPEPFQWRNSDIYTVSSSGGEIKPLVVYPGMDHCPLYSPDGKQVAFVSVRGNLSWDRDFRVCLLPAEGGEVTVLPRTHDSLPGHYKGVIDKWSVDGTKIYYDETINVDKQFFALPLDGKPYVQVTKIPGAKFCYDISADGTMVAYDSCDWDQPYEIYVEYPETGKVKKISNINGHLPKKPFARMEVIRWKSFDGLEIEGILTYPLNYEKGKRYPLVIELHGGPTDAFLRDFSAGFYKSQVFAGKSMAVLQPNVRGSNGRGKEFRFANLKDLGGNDVKDVLAGVDYLIEKGLADPDRLGVHGWSYGSYLTSMVISRCQRFKAAVCVAGSTNLVSSVLDIKGFFESLLECEMWECQELWRDRSAVFHVGHITTPTLFLHGKEDARAPYTQSLELYSYLKRKGVETQLVLYPRCDHGVEEPKLNLDLWNRLLKWMCDHLLK